MTYIKKITSVTAVLRSDFFKIFQTISKDHQDLKILVTCLETHYSDKYHKKSSKQNRRNVFRNTMKSCKKRREYSQSFTTGDGLDSGTNIYS